MKIGITERGDAGVDFTWKLFKGPKILITKSPQNLLGESLENCIVHCTITGLGSSKIEPNVKPKEETIPAYHSLVDKLGPDRVVLRVDPVIPYEPYILEAISVVEQARGRIRISFLDAYNHVRDRFKNIDFEFPWSGLHAPKEIRKSAFRRVAKRTNYNVEVCGEPDFSCTGCVSVEDFKALNIEAPSSSSKGFQRKTCCCLAEKKELLHNKNQCIYGCLYCYWK